MDTAVALREFTDEELRAELKRRRDEEQQRMKDLPRPKDCDHPSVVVERGYRGHDGSIRGGKAYFYARCERCWIDGFPGAKTEGEARRRFDAIFGHQRLRVVG